MDHELYDAEQVLDDLMKQLKMTVNAAQGMEYPTKVEFSILCYVQMHMNIPREEWWQPGDPTGYEEEKDV